MQPRTRTLTLTKLLVVAALPLISVFTPTAISAAASAATPACSTAASWPQFRFDSGHTGDNTQENCLSAANVSGLVRVWHHGADGTYSDPVVGGGKVILTTRSKGACSSIEALNAATGSVSWSHTISGAQIRCNDPVITGGRVLMSTRNPGTLYSWNLATGQQSWAPKTLPKGTWSALTAVAGDIYLVSSSGMINQRSATSGGSSWVTSIGHSIADYAPAIAGGRLYLTTTAGAVYALGLGEGHILWHMSSGVPASTNGATLAVSGYRLFVDSNLSDFYAVGIYSHKILWNATTLQFNSDFATDGSRVYVVTPPQGPHGNGPSVFGLSASTGKQVWQFTTGYVGEKPSVANGIVYVSNDGVESSSGLFALNATTGVKLWSGQGAGSYPSYPAITGGAVYISNSKYTLPQ